MVEEMKKPTIEELEAILNDPTPQKIQLLPDGSICAVPDEGAELVKQARAEVLAAFEKLRHEVEVFLANFGAMPQVEFVADRYTWKADQYKALIRLNNYVHDLQPTASALEELLRKERESVHGEMSLIAAQAARVLAGNAPKNGEAKQFATFVLKKARAAKEKT